MAKRRSKGQPVQRRAAGEAGHEVEGPPWPAHLDRVSAWWYVAALLSFWTFGFTVRRQGDLWWHLAAGRWMWDHRSLASVDPWSFAKQGQPWLHHEWLADIIYEAWVRLFGIESLVYWKWTLLLTTFLLLLRLLHRLTDHIVASYAATLLAVATAAPFIDMRPQLYSLLGYVVLLYVLLLRPHPPWSLPLLFVVWVNLHGGFLFGLIILTVVLAVTIGLGPRGPAEPTRAVIVWVGCLLASLINPYGVRAFGYPLKYAFDASSPFRALLTEWSSPFLPGGVQAPLFPVAMALALVASTVVFVVGLHRDPRRLTLAGLALAVVTLAMALTSRRFISLFAVSQSLVTAPALGWVLDRLARSLPAILGRVLRHPVLQVTAPVVVAAGAVGWLVAHPPSPKVFSEITAEASFPVEAARFIAANRLSGNVFTQWTYGGYLQLRAPGLVKIYVDQRADTVFDADTYRRYIHVEDQTPGWTRILESSGAEYCLWPRSWRGVQTLLASGNWRVLHEDRVAILLGRADIPLPPGSQTSPSRSPAGSR